MPHEPHASLRSNWLLEVRAYACGMCGEAFVEDAVTCVDHDHACCPDGKRPCGRCIRGLLCLGCNTTPGKIGHKFEMTQAYITAPWQAPADRVAPAEAVPASDTLSVVGRLAQSGMSASLTPKRSQVQILYRPPKEARFSPPFSFQDRLCSGASHSPLRCRQQADDLSGRGAG